MQTITLNNGVEMPMLGYGVYQVDPAECERCVRDAIEVGYRSIDSAQAYFNEEGVGAAVAVCGVPREELFLTTKVWISNAGERAAAASIDESLRKLGTDYIDLLLIHQPFGDYYGSYRAMEKALVAGKLRAIGVSNFYPARLIDICRFADVVPAVNQIETHALHQQSEAHDVMVKYGVVHESWGPFAEGRKDFFTNPVLAEVGAAHGKSVAQVALRFLIQSDVVVIPKSARRERMAQNFDVFDFTLSDEQMAQIRAIDHGESAFFSHADASTAERLISVGNPRR